MTDRLSYAEVVVGNGASLSGEVDLRNHDLIGIEMPAAWTAAAISFKGTFRNDGASGATLTETFVPVVDQAGAEVTVTAAAATYIALSQDKTAQMRAMGRVKLVSGTNASPVAQGAARTVRLILAQLL